MKDRVFAKPLSEISDFSFDEKVSRAFDDMARRSVPFYEEVQRITAELCMHFYRDKSIIYDLGSSTGRTASELVTRFGKIPFKYIGIDSSSHMVNKSKSRRVGKADIKFENHSICDYDYRNAGVFIANYTLQFIRQAPRAELLRKMHDSLCSGGVVILSEKVLENSSRNSQVFQEMYYEFKRRNGYSDLEISQKREALENILIPYRLDEYKSLLSEAGFDNIAIVFKWYNFATLLAYKS